MSGRRRGWTILAAGALLLVYLGLGVLMAVMLVLLWNPYLGLYRPLSVALAVALTAVAFRYFLFYGHVVRRWGDFRPRRQLDRAAILRRPWPFMKFQVTTKGGAVDTVERSLSVLRDFCARHPGRAGQITAEVMTEVEAEAEYLEARFAGSPLAVTAITLPADYATPAGTRLKARALHYMVERRRAGLNRRPGRTFVVHLDDETLIREDELLVLASYLSADPRPVSEGPIFYPLDWREAPWLCRVVESIRPFGCSECAHTMRHPPPTHLHGSNLVVDEEVENLVGWDIGTLDGQAFVAEDLVFGLRCYSVLGPEGFGWHGATMLEQPPLSLYWAFRQRQRWVLGALQGVRALWVAGELAGIPKRDRVRISGSILYRVGTYALGFPLGLAGLLTLVHGLLGLVIPGMPMTPSPWTWPLLAAAAGWLLSYQIGLARNLRDQQPSPMARLANHLVVLLLTPVAGLAETAGPFTAVVKWVLGLRHVSWTPTLKATGEGPALSAGPARAGRPVPAWRLLALGLLPVAGVAAVWLGRPATPAVQHGPPQPITSSGQPEAAATPGGPAPADPRLPASVLPAAGAAPAGTPVPSDGAAASSPVPVPGNSVPTAATSSPSPAVSSPPTTTPTSAPSPSASGAPPAPTSPPAPPPTSAPSPSASGAPPAPTNAPAPSPTSARPTPTPLASPTTGTT